MKARTMTTSKRDDFQNLPPSKIGSGRPLIAIGIVAILVLVVGLVLEFNGVSVPLAIPGYAIFYGLLGIVAGWYILANKGGRREPDNKEGSE